MKLSFYIEQFEEKQTNMDEFEKSTVNVKMWVDSLKIVPLIWVDISDLVYFSSVACYSAFSIEMMLKKLHAKLTSIEWGKKVT